MGRATSLNKDPISSQCFDRAHVPEDVFGNAYEYRIRSFASKAGKSSGECYTPKEVAFLMSEIIEPKREDSLRQPLHLDAGKKLMQFDRIVMNPPFSLAVSK